MIEEDRSLVNREGSSSRVAWTRQMAWPRCQADGNRLDLLVAVKRDPDSAGWLIEQKSLVCAIGNRELCVSRGDECKDLVEQSIDYNLDSHNDRWSWGCL